MWGLLKGLRYVISSLCPYRQGPGKKRECPWMGTILWESILNLHFEILFGEFWYTYEGGRKQINIYWACIMYIWNCHITHNNTIIYILLPPVCRGKNLDSVSVTCPRLGQEVAETESDLNPLVKPILFTTNCVC